MDYYAVEADEMDGVEVQLEPRWEVHTNGRASEGTEEKKKKAEINGESNFHLFYFPEIYWS